MIIVVLLCISVIKLQIPQHQIVRDIEKIKTSGIKDWSTIKNRIKDIHDKEYIGTWALQGEITELPRIFNPNKKKEKDNSK